jgi:hypothetical protein
MQICRCNKFVIPGAGEVPKKYAITGISVSYLFLLFSFVNIWALPSAGLFAHTRTGLSHGPVSASTPNAGGGMAGDAILRVFDKIPAAPLSARSNLPIDNRVCRVVRHSQEIASYLAMTGWYGCLNQDEADL